jgi:hypothetical protein
MKRLVNNNPKSKKKLNATRRPVGRPNSSGGVRVVPVYRDEIDVRKLGRAALRLAMLKSDVSVDDSIEDTNDEA